MLTVTEVQCIPQGTASTRLHVARPTSSWDQLKDFKSSNIFRRSDQAMEAALTDLATSFADALPDVSSLSGGLKDSFTNIASAMFALTICDSGINLTSTCDQLGTGEVAYNLLQSWYNPDSIKSIVCFCATYGYDFNTSRQQLYASLYAALIGTLAAGGVGTDRGQICDNLGLFNRTGPSLGINIGQYHDLVCSNIPSATPTGPSGYGVPTPVIPYVTDGMTTWVTATFSPPNMTMSPTGGPGGSNDTNATSTWGPPISYTGTGGTDWSMTMNTQTNFTGAQPTGTAAASDTSSAASNETMLVARTPRGPHAMPFYPAITTPASRPGLFKRY